MRRENLGIIHERRIKHRESRITESGLSNCASGITTHASRIAHRNSGFTHQALRIRHHDWGNTTQSSHHASRITKHASLRGMAMELTLRKLLHNLNALTDLSAEISSTNSFTEVIRTSLHTLL